MRMGEFSRRTGVSQRSLRYYEEQGLLRPTRRPSGYREYEEPDVVTVRGIRMLLAAGLNTAVIAELLPCMVDEGRILEPACSSMLPGLHRERARIDEAATALLAARDRLDALIELTAESGVTDEEACAAVAGDPKRKDHSGISGPR
ncbi:MerR family transcriptional regulator [Streptomyces globisporus]|uniref:MerR family transcriptional regulator n=1 Tax=Streptomyces globisporus TaxID=1908 RepID=UPI0005CA77B4|nr:MerR family transcriptional regulator [Streptomyces globisporus]AWL88453.1 MerR family transcriptional regulator [Streptomyces globisporus]PPA42341.1 MerR family transcriptional regulator [Streptomyces griseus]RAN19640.1 MerR family transcriptional regulator [Streptomyces badius]RAN27556.1 MerR family transcriptional regulator [Streptomyces badius]